MADAPISLSQLKKLAVRVNEEIEAVGNKIPAVPDYTIKRQSAAEDGYSATYYLEKDGVQIGEKINIEKDFLIKDAELRTATADNDPIAGISAGDKYIDFIINSQEGDDNASHIYLSVQDLMITEGGDGIVISGHEVAIQLDTANAHGLGFTENGLKLDEASTTSSGAMSASDKVKLNTVEANLNSHVGNTSNPHGVTPAQIGAVPNTRTVNGKALSADITLTAADIGSLSSSGTATSATKLSTARNIALTGDVTGSTTFDGSADKSIATTLSSSGVTAGSYGPAGNVSPGSSGTFAVPQVTVDAKGRVTTAVNRTITLPAGMSLTNSTSSTSTTTAATPASVCAAYSRASSAYTQANNAYAQANNAYDAANAAASAAAAAATTASGKWTAVDATTTVKGITMINSSTSNTSQTVAATPYAVNAAYSRASSAYAQANNAYNQANAAYDAVNAVAIGTVASANKLSTARTIDGVSFDGSAAIIHYGTCATAAATAAKVVALTGFALVTGAKIAVRFTYSNTASAPTLNVNSTGDIAIKMYGSTAPATYMWYPNTVVEFVYDGTYWMMITGKYADTTYYGPTKLSSSTSSTSTVLAATASAVKAAYDLANTANGVANNSYEKANSAYTLASAALPSTSTATAASKLAAAQTISLSGDVTGATTFDGSTASSITTTLASSGVTASTYGPFLNGICWMANNGGIKSTTATLTLTALRAGTFRFLYAGGGEENYDYLTVALNGTVVLTTKGVTSPYGGYYEMTLAVGDVVLFSHIEDSSYFYDGDYAGIGNMVLGNTNTNFDAITPDNIGTYFTVENGTYTFTPMMVFTGGSTTVDAKGRITSAKNIYPTIYTMDEWKNLTGDGGGSDSSGSGSGINYGTCDTAAATAAKVVTLSGFTLTTGAKITVKFTYTNTASSPTLNVNSTGAISIMRYGTTALTTYMWYPNAMVEFVYDGTYWIMVDGTTATTTYYGMTKLSTSTTSTSTVLAATPYAVCAAYALANTANTAASDASTTAAAAYAQANAAYEAANAAADAASAASGWTAVNASTTVRGITYLVNSVTSTSTTNAATPASVCAAYNRASTAYNRANDAYNAANNSSPTIVTATLTTSGWSSSKQTVTVTGVSATETAQVITPIPSIASQSAYIKAGVLCTNQAANSLTFTCTNTPTASLTVYVSIVDV